MLESAEWVFNPQKFGILTPDIVFGEYFLSLIIDFLTLFVNGLFYTRNETLMPKEAKKYCKIMHNISINSV